MVRSPTRGRFLCKVILFFWSLQCQLSVPDLLHMII